jgi:hypothetical protein
MWWVPINSGRVIGLAIATALSAMTIARARRRTTERFIVSNPLPDCDLGLRILCGTLLV